MHDPEKLPYCADVMIYLDANATTPMLPEVMEVMLPWLRERFGNPSSAHRAGRHARRGIEIARAQVAALLQAQPEEIIFTSGATESINTVISFAQQEWPDRAVLITSQVEHAVGVEAAERWQDQGGEVRRIPVDEQGLLNLGALEAELKGGRVALASFIWGNNETGVMTPMSRVVELCHSAGTFVHADAVQVAGKMPLDVKAVPVDYLSLSSHKMHGPQGVGVLFVNRNAPFRPLLIGGGQEAGRRSGTENVAGIIGIGQAASMATAWIAASGAEQMSALRDDLEIALRQGWSGSRIHGALAPRLPGTCSICLPGVDAAAMLIRLDQRGIACSGGSACHTGSLHPSPVLEAMGCDASSAASTLRLSLSRLTTAEDIRRAAQEILDCARHIEQQSGSKILGS
jgi:cysteine desulfurase